jgi:hypothetical protein
LPAFFVWVGAKGIGLRSDHFLPFLPFLPFPAFLAFLSFLPFRQSQ